MFQKSIGPVSSGGLNVLKTGGTLTLTQRIQGFIQGLMTWKFAGIVVLVLILCIFAYSLPSLPLTFPNYYEQVS
jgi:hypothetical protein